MASDTPEFQKRVEDALAKGLPLPDFPDVSPINGLAMAMNEAHKIFIKEGFESNQALYAVAAMFTGNPGIAPNK